MERAEQMQGERRVRDRLIDPLLRMGLAKPSSLTNAQFEAMVEDLCQKLAYMTEMNLAALVEVVASNPAGKDKDRLPIGAKILGFAGQIQPPGDDASPLIRAVFAQALGQDALAGGWAPELLAEVRKSRRWPNAYVVNTIRQDARDASRKLDDLDRVVAGGGDLTPSEAAFRDHRRAMLDRCRAIAELSAEGKA